MRNYWDILMAIVAALGGWQFVKYVLNLNSNRRITAAEAVQAEYKNIITEYQRVSKEFTDYKAETKKEISELNKKVDDLYKKVHELENERLNLIKENNELKLALKEAEKHVCWRPVNECFQRLIESDHCLYRKLIRGVKEQHPNAIVTEEDMKNGGTEDDKDSGIPEEPREG